MPKLIAHALTGAAIIIVIHPKISPNNLIPVFAGMCLALSPDLDIIGEWLFGVPDFHRGLTHSLLFSLCVAAAIFSWQNTVQENTAAAAAAITAAYSLCYLSHPLLDFAASTSGGVKLLYPFSDKFYYLGITDIFELPFGSNLSEILLWCRVELLVFLPLLLFAGLIRYFLSHFAQ